MATAYRVAQDSEGIRRAALELFEENLLEQEARMKERLLTGANRDAALAGYETKRTLSEGYYSWAQYLMWLKGQLALGADVVQIRVTADEADGLRVMESAFDEFRRSHPGCPHCGALNRAFSLKCWSCSKDMKERR